MRIKTVPIRGVRKAAHITHGISVRAARFAERAELKVSRIIAGADRTFGAVAPPMPFEELRNENLPHIIPVNPVLPALGRKPTVTLLVPTLHKQLFFGGIATAIMAAASLAEKKKFDLRIISTVRKSEVPVKELLDSAGIAFSGEVFHSSIAERGNGVNTDVDIHPKDIFMASAWVDAYLLQQLPLPSKFVYLIQDYEPAFFPNGDEHVLAQSTYRSDRFIALCNTKLMYDFLVDQGYTNVKKGTWFEPAVSYHARKHNDKSAAGKRRMFIYGRTRVKRNLFFTAFEGVNRCFLDGHLDSKEWEVVMAGQDDVPDLELSSGVVVKNLGKMDLDEYQRFTGTVDVTVSLMMAPHPNYPTLEMASAGSAVVTTRYGIKQDLSHYSKNIIMADTTPESVCESINKAAKLDTKTRFKNAKASTIPDDWNATLRKPIEFVIKAIK